MVNEGSIRKITSKVYTPNMEDSLEDIVRRNVFRILGFLFPHAVISHRSAFELKCSKCRIIMPVILIL